MIQEFKQLPLRTKVLFGALVLVLLLAGTSAIVNWYKPSGNPQVFTQAPEIPKLSSVPKISVAVPSVQVYAKNLATKVLPSIPQDVKDNPNVEIMNSATTGPTKSGYEIISTINKNDGSTSIYYKEKQRSLVEFVSDKRVGVAGGVSTDKGQPVVKVYGEWTFFRVGEAHLSAQAELRAKQLQNSEAVGMVGVDYRW